MSNIPCGLYYVIQSHPNIHWKKSTNPFYCYILLQPINQFMELPAVFFILHHFHSPYKSVAFSHSASCLPNITGWFPCQQFLGDYSGALVWKLRKCVITDNVGGERSSVCGGMPKGRNEWAAEMYIKRSWLVLRVHGSLRLAHTHSVISQQSFRAKSRLEKEQTRIAQISSHQAENPGLNIKQPSLIDYFMFLQKSFASYVSKLVETADQTRQNF